MHLKLFLFFSFFFSTSTELLSSELSSLAKEELNQAIREYLLENPEVIFEAIEVFEKKQQKLKDFFDEKLINENIDALLLDEFSYVGGNKKGSVTIVEFIDYKCGYCKRAHQDISLILKENKDLRYIVKELPILGKESMLAAKFAIAIFISEGDEKYKLFNNILLNFSGPITTDSLKYMVRKAGAITEDIEVKANSATIQKIISKNKILARNLRIAGTPTFVIGNKIIRGYKSKVSLQEIINSIKQ